MSTDHPTPRPAAPEAATGGASPDDDARYEALAKFLWEWRHPSHPWQHWINYSSAGHREWLRVARGQADLIAAVLPHDPIDLVAPARRLPDAIGRDTGRSPTLDQARGHLAAAGVTGEAGAGPTVREALVGLGIDTPVANAIVSGLDETQHGQPEWLWYDHDHGQTSLGRWPKAAGSAPYIRGDVLARLAERPGAEPDAARAAAPGAGRALREAEVEGDRDGIWGRRFAAARAFLAYRRPSAVDETQGALAAWLRCSDGQALIAALDAALAQAGQDAPASFQVRNAAWMVKAMHDDPTDPAERVHRFTEEALELGQALGQTAAEAHALVDYVHGRPKGDPAQEVGGTMTTLALLCAVAGIDMDAAGEAELARCSTPEIMAKIREKRSKRHGRGPLPGVYGPDFVPQAEGDGWRQPCSVCFTPNACRSSRRCGAAHLVSSAGAKP